MDCCQIYVAGESLFLLISVGLGEIKSTIAKGINSRRTERKVASMSYTVIALSNIGKRKHQSVLAVSAEYFFFLCGSFRIDKEHLKVFILRLPTDIHRHEPRIAIRIVFEVLHAPSGISRREEIFFHSFPVFPFIKKVQGKIIPRLIFLQPLLALEVR